MSLISEELFTKINLNVGQKYKIKTIVKLLESAVVVVRKARLIQQTKYFFTFEYKSKSGDFLRTTINKFDYYRNPSLIGGIDDKNNNRGI